MWLHIFISMYTGWVFDCISEWRLIASDHAASSEDEFKPDSDKSDNEEEEDEDDELSVVESTSGSSPEESEIETPEKVFLSLYFVMQ